MFDATQLRCAFLEPPSIDARLVHQQGLFSVLSPEADMEALLLSHPSCARKIIVPAWLKREVRDKLDAIGVSERTLFPGLDGLCTWLRRYYTLVRGLLALYERLRGVCAVAGGAPHAVGFHCAALRCSPPRGCVGRWAAVCGRAAARAVAAGVAAVGPAARLGRGGPAL